MRHEIVTESHVCAPSDDVWDRAVSTRGINDELWPVMRMTVPRHLRDATLMTVPVGVRVARSWILLFGVIPFEYDDIVIAEREDRHHFLEQSQMLNISDWVHERTITDDSGCTLVRDRVQFELRPMLQRVPASAALVGAFLRYVFRHRHRRLRRHYEGSHEFTRQAYTLVA